jgi:uncharacterized protein YndB with AHSA1/START domain
MAAACYPYRQFSSEPGEKEARIAVVNTVTIAGAPEAVFDLVTTAKLWPQWHPATQAVGGVTERPYVLNDLIHERGRIGNQDFQTTWKVLEHARPSRVVLQSQSSPTRIIYSFQRRNGTTVFTRRLEYRLEVVGAVAPTATAAQQLMRAQSQQAVNQLKALVEKILSGEAGKN